jgi:hypothetical protein
LVNERELHWQEIPSPLNQRTKDFPKLLTVLWLVKGMQSRISLPSQPVILGPVSFPFSWKMRARHRTDPIKFGRKGEISKNKIKMNFVLSS